MHISIIRNQLKKQERLLNWRAMSTKKPVAKMSEEPFWDDLAGAYEQTLFHQLTSNFAPIIAELAIPYTRSDQEIGEESESDGSFQVVDIGSGSTGIVAQKLMPRMRPTDHLIASDFSPKMVALLDSHMRHKEHHGTHKLHKNYQPIVSVKRAEEAEEASPDLLLNSKKNVRIDSKVNLSTAILDAMALKLDGNSCDVVTSGFSAMFFQNQLKAFSEMHRVLKPNHGRAVVAVWGNPVHQPAIQTFFKTLNQVDKDFPADTSANLNWSLSDAWLLKNTLKMAGFRNVDLLTLSVNFFPVDLTHHLLSSHQMLSSFSEACVHTAQSRLPDSLLKSFSAKIRENSSFLAENRLLTAEAHIAVASK